MMLRLSNAAYKTHGKFIALIIIIVFSIVIPNIYDLYNTKRESDEIDRQKTAQVYSLPWNVSWEISEAKLVVSATVKKLEDCHVIAGTKPILIAYWETSDGVLHSSEHEPTNDSGVQVRSAPRYVKGDVFKVGPWRIVDTIEKLNMIEAVSIKQRCEFESGVQRYVSIGPVEKPNEL